ncbi:MAG: molybdate ABC transporter substrate-binding protein [Oceanospirillaceae bacterium]|nr:molybdate ABC transporter substrate-binding protein [Oceanospirillaceae bacterium]MBT10596.1 molybdate ABC transporter substrate-binding protein [Oceanospirillaceae bacterium]|tara:strand:+ start:19881 stop:20606 length:726 start_codon:yes stop_codon:yes gene_type:complete
MLTVLMVLSVQVNAGEVMVAVAANFTAPMKEIAAQFEQATGHKATLAFGSSGKFLAQIQNGAPFDVFLSADQAKPIRLEDAGTAVTGSRFTYAQGGLALWSAEDGQAPKQRLEAGSFKKLALANPRLAPYGEAAVQTLQHMHLEAETKSRWVMGENISQTWQFAATGNAQLGFVAMSQIMADGQVKSGSAWIIPSDYYQPIRQDAVLLKKGQGNPAADALLKYLQTDAVATLIARYGYSRN